MSTPEITPTVAAPPVEPSMSQLSRIVNVFFEPGKVFADLNKSRKWWLAWLLATLLGMGYMFAVQQHIGWQKVVENSIANSPKQAEQLDKLSPEQRANQIAISVKISSSIMYAMPIITLLIAAVVAGVLTGVFNFGFGAKVSFQHSLAIYMYATMPGILFSLLAIAVMFMADPSGFDINNPLPSNLGALFDASSQKFLHSFLGAFDILTIWQCALLGVGYSKASKVKASTAFYAIFGLVVFYKLLAAGLGAIMS